MGKSEQLCIVLHKPNPIKGPVQHVKCQLTGNKKRCTDAQNIGTEDYVSLRTTVQDKSTNLNMGSVRAELEEAVELSQQSGQLAKFLMPFTIRPN